MEAARSVQLFQEWIRQDHGGVHQAFQDNAQAAVPEIPHLHGPDESCNAVPLVWGLLRLTSIIIFLYFMQKSAQIHKYLVLIQSVPRKDKINI